MDKIKQIRKDFNIYSKKLSKHFKNFYKALDDDIDYFCYASRDYDFMTQDEQAELENIVLSHEEFFMLVNKCKHNLFLVQYYNVTDKFTQKELDLYSELFNVLNDMQFSKQFKINLLKKKVIVNENYSDDKNNNFDI